MSEVGSAHMSEVGRVRMSEVGTSQPAAVEAASTATATATATAATATAVLVCLCSSTGGEAAAFACTVFVLRLSSLRHGLDAFFAQPAALDFCERHGNHCAAATFDPMVHLLARLTHEDNAGMESRADLNVGIASGMREVMDSGTSLNLGDGIRMGARASAGAGPTSARTGTGTGAGVDAGVGVGVGAGVGVSVDASAGATMGAGAWRTTRRSGARANGRAAMATATHYIMMFCLGASGSAFGKNCYSVSVPRRCVSLQCCFCCCCCC